MTLKNIKDYIENKLENTQWIVDVIINNETKSVDVNLEIYSPAGRDVCVEFTFEEGTTKSKFIQNLKVITRVTMFHMKLTFGLTRADMVKMVRLMKWKKCL